MKQENIISKIITVVLALLLFAYIGFQAYRAFYNPVRTVSAVYTQVDDVIDIDGIVIRDESVLRRGTSSGVLEMNVYEGERTGNGGTVAVIYADENSAQKSREAEELSEQISRMNALYSKSGENYDISAANDKISDQAVKLLTLWQDGVSNTTEETVEALKLQVLEREYIYRDKAELLEVIEDLRKERDKLRSGTSVKKRIYSPAAGYFSQYTDGYEKALTVDLAMSASVSEFEKSAKSFAEGAGDAVGKLISTNKWYLASVIDEKEASRLSPGAIMSLKFSDKALPSVNAEIVRLTEPENGKVLAVFCCNTHISNFTKVRKISADAVVKTYSGLKVPREALRVSEDGQNGVYCLIDSQVKFKPVDIIFEKDSYYISAYDSADTKSLLLYDEIVVSAKNLENRKIVK
ncbi:MAG: hypothetical protein IIV97_05185 [Oscillospiraceae bacterium]|nr:hypothetical protein [Oscillospiraceae bacterium]